MICWECKHPLNQHFENITSRPVHDWCKKCWAKSVQDKDGGVEQAWHNIKNNLDYIEDLAKEKNLI